MLSQRCIFGTDLRPHVRNTFLAEEFLSITLLAKRARANDVALQSCGAETDVYTESLVRGLLAGLSMGKGARRRGRGKCRQLVVASAAVEHCTLPDPHGDRTGNIHRGSDDSRQAHSVLTRTHRRAAVGFGRRRELQLDQVFVRFVRLILVGPTCICMLASAGC
jgi:hypothetical protein